jgi:hypothetical protein
VALGVVRDLRSPRSLATAEDAAAYQEHLLAEYVLARLAHGVADGTIRGEMAAVEQFLDQAGVPDRAGTTAAGLRADRLLDEAQATGGDPLRLTHLFGISDPAAIGYCAELGPADRRPAYLLAGERR